MQLFSVCRETLEPLVLKSFPSENLQHRINKCVCGGVSSTHTNTTNPCEVAVTIEMIIDVTTIRASAMKTTQHLKKPFAMLQNKPNQRSLTCDVQRLKRLTERLLKAIKLF